MDNLRLVLDKLDEHDMHVHVINPDERLPIPLAFMAMSTHFVMNGADIVHVGNVETIERFALGL